MTGEDMTGKIQAAEAPAPTSGKAGKPGGAVKKAFKGFLFTAIFCGILYLVSCVLLFKQEDGTLPMRNYYDLPPDTVDVLFLGSSHIGMNLSMQVLWEDYGIAGYKCWGSTQPIWNTYHYLVECLKTQRPKVVVVDVHGSVFSYDYGDYALQVKNTMGMRLSGNKIEAVMASAPRESWADLLLGLPTYHTRYGELTEADFEYFPWDNHSDITVLVNQSQDIVFPFDIIPPDQTQGAEPLNAKEEEYLRRIIELCRKQAIPLELVTAPYQVSEYEQKRFRAVSELAAEYDGLTFTNYNEHYAEYGIDPRKDFLDPGHFNASGVPKYTNAMAALLLSKYDLPDRRKDETHIWNQTAKEAVRPIYAMTEQFNETGKQRFIDTGVQLYDNALASWSVAADFVIPPAADEDRIVYSCYNETINEYQGLLVNVDHNNMLSIRFSSYENFYAGPMEDGTRCKLVVSKERDTITVYLNGERLGVKKPENLARYTGNLLIGCQETAEGEPFRFSHPHVYDLQVYDYAMTDQQAAAWTPAELPEPQITFVSLASAGEIYQLETTFRGDGFEKYRNTGVRLFEDPEASWTILTSFDSAIPTGDNVYLSCFLEDASNYHGLLVRRPSLDQLNIVYGNSASVNAALPENVICTLAVVKDESAYSVYLNGEPVLEQAVSPCGAYGGPLYIGCEETAEGVPFRFSGVSVYDLKIVGGALSREEIAAWRPQGLSEEPEPIGSDVTYSMAEAIAGDSLNRGLDTGIQLYDVSDKSWSLHLVLDNVHNGAGTALSCFAEDPAAYRGLLVRQTDENTLSVTLGTEYREVSIPPERVCAVDILKEAYHYRVYVNGALRLEADSRCKSWGGTLAVCAEKTLDGQLFRYARQNVRRLEITNRLITENEIQAMYETDRNRQYIQKIN